MPALFQGHYCEGESHCGVEVDRLQSATVFSNHADKIGETAMFNRILAITSLLSFASVAISQESEVSKELLSSIKSYHSTDEDCETFSFRLEESIGNHISMRIDACHMGNRRIALMISESKSECPIAIFVDDQFLVVDIVAGRIFRGSGLTTSAEISQEKNRLRTHWFVSPIPEKQKLTLELRSLLPNNDVEPTWLDCSATISFPL